MTVLQALDGYYDRMAARGEAEPTGFTREKISFAIVLSAQGEPIEASDLREKSGKRLVPRSMSVPSAVKRTVAILPNLLWDKTAYVLGRTAGEGKRAGQEHAAFKAAHAALLRGANDPGLVALRLFLETWTPERFDAGPFVPEMLDANIVFRLEGERGYLHDRDAAKTLLVRGEGGADGPRAFCLVTGRKAPVRRLHPTIKNVNGAQSSGAALVSFNLDAFSSYGKEQGDNAPTSEDAAFRYAAALNGLLDRNGGNRLKGGIGDATVAYWADASGAEQEAAAKAAEDLFGDAVEPPTDAQAAKKVREQLELVRDGRAVGGLDARLDPKTRFHVLGLSPNAARLSVRYWLTDEFGAFAARLARHHDLLRLEPVPRGWTLPSLNLLLARTTALQGKFENIPPLLAGETMRAMMTGAPYPRTLLAAAIQRLRAGDDPATGWHAAVIKACLNRARNIPPPREGEPPELTKRRHREELPMALEPGRKDPPYQLGRLFAVLEAAQYAALGRVNATIGDRYYASASSTPARVFGTLLRGLKVHVADARKRNQGFWIEGAVADIVAMLPAELPKTLKLEEQGRFAVGYYHERGARRAKTDETTSEGETDQ